MSGNYSQYDPSDMFKEWIQKSGRAQTEFIKNFGSLMNNQSSQTFNPLEALTSIKQSVPQYHQSITNVQQEYLQAYENIVDSSFTMQKEIAKKSGIAANIPEAERNALGLGEGDLVQVIILPIGKKSGKPEVKK
jgi:hypothetical protein